MKIKPIVIVMWDISDFVTEIAVFILLVEGRGGDKEQPPCFVLKEMRTRMCVSCLFPVVAILKKYCAIDSA